MCHRFEDPEFAPKRQTKVKSVCFLLFQPAPDESMTTNYAFSSLITLIQLSLSSFNTCRESFYFAAKILHEAEPGQSREYLHLNPRPAVIK